MKISILNSYFSEQDFVHSLIHIFIFPLCFHRTYRKVTISYASLLYRKLTMVFCEHHRGLSCCFEIDF